MAKVRINASGSDCPTLRDLGIHVIPYVTHCWYELGLHLLDPKYENELNMIKTDTKHDVEKCCRKMFRKWLETNKLASWDKVMEALIRIELYSIASDIKQMLRQVQPNLKDLNNVMRQEARGIATKWYILGVKLLNGNTAVLDLIETNYLSDDDRCSRMFKKWLEMKPDASWSQLVIALKNIGMNTAADNVYHSKISKEGNDSSTDDSSDDEPVATWRGRKRTKSKKGGSKLWRGIHSLSADNGPISTEAEARACFQYLTEAKKNNMVVKFKHMKIVLSGSSAAGKSSFCRLLFRCNFSKEYHSTDVMEAKHGMSMIRKVNKDALTVKNFRMVQQEDDMMWLELNPKNQLMHFKSVLSSMFEHNNAMTNQLDIEQRVLSSSVNQLREQTSSALVSSHLEEQPSSTLECNLFEEQASSLLPSNQSDEKVPITSFCQQVEQTPNILDSTSSTLVCQKIDEQTLVSNHQKRQPLHTSINNQLEELLPNTSVSSQQDKQTSSHVASGIFGEQMSSTLMSNQVKEQTSNQEEQPLHTLVSNQQISDTSICSHQEVKMLNTFKSDQHTSTTIESSQLGEQLVTTVLNNQQQKAFNTSIFTQQREQTSSNSVNDQLEKQTSNNLDKSHLEEQIQDTSIGNNQEEKLPTNLESILSEEQASGALMSEQTEEHPVSTVLNIQEETMSNPAEGYQQEHQTLNIVSSSSQTDQTLSIETDQTLSIDQQQEKTPNSISACGGPLVQHVSCTNVEKKIMSSPALPHTVKIDDTIKLITVLDTGGQPEFVMLLPAINSMPTINFVIHNLTKNLEDPVLVRYRKGDVESPEYMLEYSNLDMIQLLLCLITDSLEQTPEEIPQCITVPEKSRIGFVGTHYDKIKHKVSVLQNVNDRLKCITDERKCEYALLAAQDDYIIFPVDNTKSGGADREGDVVKLIREHVEDITEEMEPNELPITWMILELEMQVLRSDENKKYITYEEYERIAKENASIADEKEIKASLQYFHILGVVLYFNVTELSDWVIIDLQWLFTNLAKIMHLSSENVRISEHRLKERFNKQKLLAKKLLKRISLEGVTDKQEFQYFIETLIHLKIIATVTIEQVEYYYLPCALPSTMHYNDNCKFLLSEPLLIQFSSGYLPRGFFCSLVASLLKDLPKGWEHQLTNATTKHYSNVITFCISDKIYLRLHDKTYYLELQVRHFINQDADATHHSEIVPVLNKYIKLVCGQLRFDYNKLQYGFLCQEDCKYSTDDHVVVLKPGKLRDILKCTRNPPHKTKIGKYHRVWFSKTTDMSLHFDGHDTDETEHSTKPSSSSDDSSDEPVPRERGRKRTKYKKGRTKNRKGPVIVESENGSTRDDCVTTEANIQQHYSELYQLPVNDFMLGMFYGRKVITIDEKRVIHSTSQDKRMTYILDNVIIPSLKAKVKGKCNAFLELLKESDDIALSTVAERIGSST